MSDINKSLKSLIAFQESIDRLTNNPFESLIRQQERMLGTLAYSNQLAESVQRLQNQPVSISTPQITAVTEMITQYATMVEPFRKIAGQWNNSALLAFQESLADDSFHQQLNNISKNLASFSAAFESIAIHGNYVDMPKILIPDDFSYEEINDDFGEHTPTIEAAQPEIRKLSKSSAIKLLYNLLMLLISVLALLRTQLDSTQGAKDKEDIISALQMQIDATNKTNEYLFTLIDKLSDSPESNRKEYLPPNYTDFAPLATESDAHHFQELPPTSVDEPGNFE